MLAQLDTGNEERKKPKPIPNRIRMLLDSRVVSRADEDNEYGGIPCNVQTIYSEKRKAQESLLR